MLIDSLGQEYEQSMEESLVSASGLSGAWAGRTQAPEGDSSAWGLESRGTFVHRSAAFAGLAWKSGCIWEWQKHPHTWFSYLVFSGYRSSAFWCALKAPGESVLEKESERPILT